MKITVIHGQKHKGNTYKITEKFLRQLGDDAEIKEFYVNGISDCVGCFRCIMKDEKVCPFRGEFEDIINAIDECDVIVTESPNYCMGVTGQLKTFFDHMAYRWLIHRPNGDMRRKIGVAISTTAGAGADKTVKQICEQYMWWGVGRSYAVPFTVSAQTYDEIAPKRMAALEKKISRTAEKVKRMQRKPAPSLKTKILFGVFGFVYRKGSWNPVDGDYWKAHNLFKDR